MKPQVSPPSSLSRSRERAGVRARQLRANSTDAEQLIWRHLRNRQLLGMKFRRQHPVGAFIADFACLEAGLIVEIDGGQHFEPDAATRDERRTLVLRQAGFEVLRFDNRQVLLEVDGVLSAIHQWLSLRHPHPHPNPHPNPLPQAGEGVKRTPLPQAGEGAEDKVQT